MSKLIASAAIRGAHTLVKQAEELLEKPPQKKAKTSLLNSLIPLFIFR